MYVYHVSVTSWLNRFSNMESWEDSEIASATKSLKFTRHMAPFKNMSSGDKKALATTLNKHGKKAKAKARLTTWKQLIPKVSRAKANDGKLKVAGKIKAKPASKHTPTMRKPAAKSHGLDDNDNGKLRLGGDCDGLGAPAIALELMGVQFQHVFASEKDAATRAILYANHPGLKKVYTDVSDRLVHRVPRCDLYVSGP